MGKRRQREKDWTGPIVQLSGALVALSLLSPDVRKTVTAAGTAMIWLLAVAALGLLGCLLYKLVRPRDEESPNKPPAPAPCPSNPTTDELIDHIRRIDWFQFEKLVEATYRKLGYEVTRRGGANPDGGIDLVIEKAGWRVAVQCKQWKTWNVGVKAVREFLGAMTDAGIKDGIVITLHGFTEDARNLAEKHGIQLLHEMDLARMLETTGARSDPGILAVLNDTRKFCPKCEREMVLRTAAKGEGAGSQFWGCSGYPRCRYTMKAG